MLHNNYHCSELTCDYRTNATSEVEAEKQLVKDGGYDTKKETLCPKCKSDSLVFLYDHFKEETNEANLEIIN